MTTKLGHNTIGQKNLYGTRINCRIWIRRFSYLSTRQSIETTSLFFNDLNITRNMYIARAYNNIEFL